MQSIKTKRTHILSTFVDQPIAEVDEQGYFVELNGAFERLLSEMFSEKISNYLDFIHHPFVSTFGNRWSTSDYDHSKLSVELFDLKIELLSKETRQFRVKRLLSSKEDIAHTLILKEVTDFIHEREERKQLLETIINEFRNPVSGLMSVMNMLDDEESSSIIPPSHLYKMSKQYLHSLSSKIDHFSQLQRLINNALPSLKQPVFLTSVIDKQWKELIPLANEKNVTITWEGKVNHLWIGGNEVELAILFRHLLDNAIRYGEPDREIHLNVKEENGRVSCVLTDFGCGIPPSDLDDVFTEFRRVVSANALYHQQGNGLGLAFVKLITERHKGELNLVSSPVFGCRFTITFPSFDKTELEDAFNAL